MIVLICEIVEYIKQINIKQHFILFYNFVKYYLSFSKFLNEFKFKNVVYFRKNKKLIACIYHLNQTIYPSLDGYIQFAYV